MGSPDRRLRYASLLQLVFLSATWVAGIYVNGFVPILPATSAEAILLMPAVEIHVVLASLSAATALLVLALSWLNGQRRPTMFSLLAVVSIVIAGASGLSFVIGAAADAAESMIMASAFVTALFLTFLSMAARGGRNEVGRPIGGLPLWACVAALVLLYAVFVSGIYVNLFVAGPVFSLPLGLESAAFIRAEQSAGFIAHEALGAFLLVALGAFALSLSSVGENRLAAASLVPVLLVAYSAYVGSLNLTSPPVPAVSSSGMLSVIVPMTSAAGFVASMVITMMLALRMTKGSWLRHL